MHLVKEALLPGGLGGFPGTWIDVMNESLIGHCVLSALFESCGGRETVHTSAQTSVVQAFAAFQG